MKYKIQIKEIVTYEVSLEANSKEEAHDKFYADMNYNDSNIIGVESTDIEITHNTQ